MLWSNKIEHLLEEKTYAATVSHLRVNRYVAVTKREARGGSGGYGRS